MKIIKVCPVCGSVCVEVDSVTVDSMLNQDLNEDQIKNKSWAVCVNANCNVSYFNEKITLKINDIKVPLWFKDFGLEVPICYCSNLTRGEIIDAVKNGCRNIKEVQTYTKKNITGKCKKEKPLGQCCRNVFLQTIEEGIRS
jgi:hypothetical protein